MRAGDRVELRPPPEILATLDQQGCFEGLPFMPEMLGFFGKTCTVSARVERACDTIGYTGVRRLKDTVILDDLRCDGTAHAGCGARCRLYWKEAWLQPASSRTRNGSPTTGDAFARLERLAAANVHAGTSTPEEPTFRCQATELLRASEPVPRTWSKRSLINEYTGGNVGLWPFVRMMTRIVAEKIGRRLHLVSNDPFRARDLTPDAFVAPPLRGFQPGELVQVRTKREIRETLGENGRNRGLRFDREMLPHCGQTARVKAKVERFIDEGTGRLVELASDCYILDNVVCQSSRSEDRWFCPRAIYPWWRECWLRPLEQEAGDEATDVVRAERTSASNVAQIDSGRLNRE